ncbi:MAG: LacI family DNA-binding transcriptional regulator [Xanthomonadales bacterium]|nr:LacI family DNA-binding transcriptional regulator [Xanthomonadales bacterium]
MSARQRVTVEDIARACGLSRATVSLVLRGSPLVHRDTRQRVEEEMKRQGYVYNRAAANLRRRVSNSIALVINDLSNPFFAEFATGVDEALGGKDYVTLLGCSNESPQRQQQVLNSLMEHHPAAIILSPAENTDARDIARVVGATPLVVFNRMLDHEDGGFDHDFLGLDNRGGAMQATAHLIERGHRDIAFFGGHANSSSCQERRQGYRDALKKAGLRVHNEWMVESAPTRVDACARSEALFAGKAKPTAAVCYNDAVALGLMLGLAHHGLHPGIDFAVTGFDDIPEAAMSMPALTTLVADPRARGRQAADMVLRRVEQATPASPPNIVPVQLVERTSSSQPGSIP